jgi:hypothetical protein
LLAVLDDSASISIISTEVASPGVSRCGHAGGVAQLDDIVALVAERRRLRPRNGAYLTVAIDGRGGAGKTSLGWYLAERTQLTVIEGDDWFDPIECDDDRNGDFNEPRFQRELVEPICRGDAPFNRPFDWAVGAIVDRGLHDVRHGVAVVRCFTLTCGVDWDVRIWVETPPAVCLERAVARSPENAERHGRIWTQIWQPEEDRWLAEHDPLTTVDLIVDGTNPLDA